MKPTLDQAGKLLELVSQSGRTDEWVQEHLISSGAFSDLLAVNNLRDQNREERRRFLGASPLTTPLLDPIGTVNVLASTDTLIVSDEFVVGKNGISYIGENFKQWFYSKVEAPSAATILRRANLTRNALDDEIRKEIGGVSGKTTLGQVLCLIKRQKNGKAGVLLNNGRANIFYVSDTSGVLRVVPVDWGGGGWSVNADLVSNPYRWHAGRQVFSRNS